MNTKEPFDLAKMAITLLLVCLVVGATTGVFYFMYDTTDQRVDSMEKATVSASMDRLYDLEQEYSSNIGNFNAYPLVTNVVSALTEFQESDLLYVTVNTSQVSNQHNGADDVCTFTYNEVTLNGSDLGTIYRSDIPVTDVSKMLLPYSDCRCELYLYRYDPSSGTIMDKTSAGGMTGVLIVVQPVSLGGN